MRRTIEKVQMRNEKCKIGEEKTAFSIVPLTHLGRLPSLGGVQTVEVQIEEVKMKNE